MILADVGPVYIKILLVCNGEKKRFYLNYLNENIEKYRYITNELIIEDNKHIIIPFTFNISKNNLKETFDHEFVLLFIESEKIKTIQICCKTSEFIEELFKNLFTIPVSKRNENIHNIDLNISGIDYLSKVLNKSFFDLPNQEIVNLNKVGHVLKEVTVKNYVSLKDNTLYPFILANVAEGLSLYRVDSVVNYKRIGGGTIGATTYWNLVSYMCGYDDPEEAVNDAKKGDNEKVDLTVGDIYGGDYTSFGLESKIVASSFGKVKNIEVESLNKQDISRSLLTLFCVNVMQISYFWAKNENVDKIIIVGNPFQCLEFMQMIQMSINYFSKGKIKTYFTDFSSFFNVLGLYWKIYDLLDINLCNN